MVLDFIAIRFDLIAKSGNVVPHSKVYVVDSNFLQLRS